MLNERQIFIESVSSKHLLLTEKIYHYFKKSDINLWKYLFTLLVVGRS